MGSCPRARAALWSACGPRGLLRLLYALDRGAGAGSSSGVAALQRNFLVFASAGEPEGRPYPLRTAWVGAIARLWRALLAGWRFRSSLLR